MIAAIIGIIVIIWKIATSAVAYNVVNSAERYEAKRDEDVESSRWNKMWSDINMFIDEFKKVNGGDYKGFEDIAFANNVEMWIFSQYGYTLDDLKKSTKDKKQIKWYESVFKNGNMFNNIDSVKNYKQIYSGQWVDDIKKKVLSDIKHCNEQKTDLETKRREECRAGLRDVLITILFFVVLTIACQSESYWPAAIVLIIGALYFFPQVPSVFRFFKNMKEYMNK